MKPTGEQYLVEKQRILREHGREAMLAFAKVEQLHDYLAETGQLDVHDVALAKDLGARANQPGGKWEQVVQELVGRGEPGPPDPDREPDR